MYLNIIIEKLRKEYKSKIGLKMRNESMNDILDIINFFRIDFIVLNIDNYEYEFIKNLEKQVKVVALYNL